MLLLLCSRTLSPPTGDSRTALLCSGHMLSSPWHLQTADERPGTLAISETSGPLPKLYCSPELVYSGHRAAATHCACPHCIPHLRPRPHANQTARKVKLWEGLILQPCTFLDCSLVRQR